METNTRPGGTQAIIDKLRGAQPWLRFIGIMCWSCVGMMLALSALLLLIAGLGNVDDPELSSGKMALAGIFYGAFSLIYVYPAILFLRAARHIRRLGADNADIVEAIDAQRRIWKYVGISIIVTISLTLLLVGLAILAAISRAMHG